MPMSRVTVPPLWPEVLGGAAALVPAPLVPVVCVDDDPHAATASTDPSATTAVRADLNCLRILSPLKRLLAPTHDGREMEIPVMNLIDWPGAGNAGQGS
jgi:hypothetical protein